MIFDISHRTTYTYEAPVTQSFAQLHVLPTDLDGQLVLESEVKVDPEPNHFRQRLDFFGNPAATLMIDEPHTVLSLESRSVVDTDGRPSAFPPGASSPWETFTAVANPRDLRTVEFALDSPRITRSSDLAEYAEPSFPEGRSLAEGATDLCHRIFEDFTFDKKATKVDTPLTKVLEIRRGVCQDFTHVMIGAMRSVGLAACYVSGYLETNPPPGQPRLTGVDRTHAWVGVHLGNDEWIGVDPTNDQLSAHRYVTTARGRDYSEIAPLRGVIFTESKKTTLDVAVDVVARTPPAD